MGVWRIPDGQYMAHCHRWGGMREEKVHLAVLREYYWSLPSWKAAKENGHVSGVNIVVLGLQCGSQGPIWTIYGPINGPMPRVRWVERRKGAFGSFKRVFMVSNPLEKWLVRKRFLAIFSNHERLCGITILTNPRPKCQKNALFFYPRAYYM